MSLKGDSEEDILNVMKTIASHGVVEFNLSTTHSLCTQCQATVSVLGCVSLPGGGLYLR